MQAFFQIRLPWLHYPKSAVLQMKQATRRRSHLDLKAFPMMHSDTAMYIFTRVGELWLRKYRDAGSIHSSVQARLCLPSRTSLHRTEATRTKSTSRKVAVLHIAALRLCRPAAQSVWSVPPIQVKARYCRCEARLETPFFCRPLRGVRGVGDCGHRGGNKLQLNGRLELWLARENKVPTSLDLG